jgi:hypothetical protein
VRIHRIVNTYAELGRVGVNTSKGTKKYRGVPIPKIKTHEVDEITITVTMHTNAVGYKTLLDALEEAAKNAGMRKSETRRVQN